MSHISTIELKVKSLQALKLAAESLGCELVEGQKTFKWFSQRATSEYGHKMPPGFTYKDMGKCDHVVRVKGADSRTYEVGVARCKDGSPGYVLMLDDFCGGYGLIEKIGAGACKLKQEYGIQTAITAARAKGFRNAQRVALPDGSVTLTLTR